MKKTLFRLAMATVAALGFIACSNVEYVSLEPEANQMWKGKTHAQIIETYGAPTREVSDGSGGTILVYEQTTTTVNTYSTPTYGGYYGGIYGFYYHMVDPVTTHTETETETDYAHFYVNSKNICYKVSTNLQKEVVKKHKKK